MFTEIRYEVDGPAAIITLNRPEHLNAFTGTMMNEMIEAFDLADADDAVRAVIVTGAGRASAPAPTSAPAATRSTTRPEACRPATPHGRRATAAASSCCASSTARSR